MPSKVKFILRSVLLIAVGTFVWQLLVFMDDEFGPLHLDQDAIVGREFELNTVITLASLLRINKRPIDEACIIRPGTSTTWFISKKTIKALDEKGAFPANRRSDEGAWIVMRRQGNQESVTRVPKVKIETNSFTSFCTEDLKKPVRISQCYDCTSGYKLEF